MYHRSLFIHEPVKANQVKAHYKDGVLRLILPKIPDRRGKPIKIHVDFL